MYPMFHLLFFHSTSPGPAYFQRAVRCGRDDLWYRGSFGGFGRKGNETAEQREYGSCRTFRRRRLSGLDSWKGGTVARTWIFGRVRRCVKFRILQLFEQQCRNRGRWWQVFGLVDVTSTDRWLGVDDGRMAIQAVNS